MAQESIAWLNQHVMLTKPPADAEWSYRPVAGDNNNNDQKGQG